jgi:Enoyl-CoA hydratase/carnithine racemase
VTRLLGYARAFEWFCVGRRLSAAEAQEWGIVSEVVAAEAFEARVSEFAAELASRPTRAIAMTKRLLDQAVGSTLDDQLAREAQLQAAATAE